MRVGNVYSIHKTVYITQTYYNTPKNEKRIHKNYWHFMLDNIRIIHEKLSLLFLLLLMLMFADVPRPFFLLNFTQLLLFSNFSAVRFFGELLHKIKKYYEV